MAEEQEATSQNETSSEVLKYPVAQIPKSGTKEVSFPACGVTGIQDRSPHEVQDSDGYPVEKHTSREETTTPCLSKEMVSVGSNPLKIQQESCVEHQFFDEGTTGQRRDRVNFDGKVLSLNKTFPNGGTDDSQAHCLMSKRRLMGSVHQMDTPNVQKDSRCIQPSENSVEMSPESEVHSVQEITHTSLENNIAVSLPSGLMNSVQNNPRKNVLSGAIPDDSNFVEESKNNIESTKDRIDQALDDEHNSDYDPDSSGHGSERKGNEGQFINETEVIHNDVSSKQNKTAVLEKGTQTEATREACSNKERQTRKEAMASGLDERREATYKRKPSKIPRPVKKSFVETQKKHVMASKGRRSTSSGSGLCHGENEYDVEQRRPKTELLATHDSLAGRYNQNGRDKSPKELRVSAGGEYGTGTIQKKTDYNVDIQHDTVRSEEGDEDIDQALLRRGSKQDASEVQDGVAGRNLADGEKEIGSGKTEVQKESEKRLDISQAEFQKGINHGLESAFQVKDATSSTAAFKTKASITPASVKKQLKSQGVMKSPCKSSRRRGHTEAAENVHDTSRSKPHASGKVSDASDSKAQLRANTSPPKMHRKSNAMSGKNNPRLRVGPTPSTAEKPEYLWKASFNRTKPHGQKKIEEARQHQGMTACSKKGYHDTLQRKGSFPRNKEKVVTRDKHGNFPPRGFRDMQKKYAKVSKVRSTSSQPHLGHEGNKTQVHETHDIKLRTITSVHKNEPSATQNSDTKTTVIPPRERINLAQVQQNFSFGGIRWRQSASSEPPARGKNKTCRQAKSKSSGPRKIEKAPGRNNSVAAISRANVKEDITWHDSASSEPPDQGKKISSTKAKSSSSTARTTEATPKENIFTSNSGEVIKDNIQVRRHEKEICDSQTVPTAFYHQVERNNEEEEDKEDSQTRLKTFGDLVPQREGRISSEEEGEEDRLSSQTLSSKTVQDAVATGGNCEENLASQHHCRSKYHDMKRNCDVMHNRFKKPKSLKDIAIPWKSSGSHFIPNILPQPPFAEMDNSFLPVEHSISDNNVSESDDELDLEELQQHLYGDTYRVAQPVEGVESDFDADTQGESTRSGGGEMNVKRALRTDSKLNQATRGKHVSKNVESTQPTPSPIYGMKYGMASRNRADGEIEVRNGKTKAQKDSENCMKLCQAKCQKFSEISYKQRKDRERDYEPKVQVIVKNGTGQTMAAVLCGRFQTYEELALHIRNEIFSENSAYVYPDFTLALYHDTEIHLVGHDECIGIRADSIGGPLVLYVIPTLDIPEQWTWRLSCT